jgi:hypothetical protein
MKKVIQILNELVDKGIIKKYAIGGAVGVIFYTETFTTKDIDVSETDLNGELLKDILKHHNLYKKWRKYVKG